MDYNVMTIKVGRKGRRLFLRINFRLYLVSLVICHTEKKHVLLKFLDNMLGAIINIERNMIFSRKNRMTLRTSIIERS